MPHSRIEPEASVNFDALAQRVDLYAVSITGTRRIVWKQVLQPLHRRDSLHRLKSGDSDRPKSVFLRTRVSAQHASPLRRNGAGLLSP